MQSASSNFSAAASGSVVTWARPQLMADWAGDGFNVSGSYGTGHYGWGPYGGGADILAPSIDDLSGALGDWTVTHALDDGLPSDLHDQVVDPIGQMSASPLAGAPDVASTADWTPNGEAAAAQYFSPFNTASPVYGYDRDTAPMTLDHGLVTAAGVERVRVFTGAMADLQVSTRIANLTGVSATNRKLQALIQPPAINGTQEGLTGTWPVVYALHKAGIHVSPPPRSGCRWWAPCHGSLHPMLPDINTTATIKTFQYNTDGTSSVVRPTFVNGPYLQSALGTTDTAKAFKLSWSALGLATGSDLLSQAGSAGRLEMWVEGQSTGGAIIVSDLVKFALQHVSAASTATVTCGINHSRFPYVTVNDGAGHTTTVTASGSLPTDGAWHFLGFAWDVNAATAWISLDSTVTSGALTGAVTTSLPPNDRLDTTNGYPSLVSWLPTAEIHLTAGTQANPVNYPWINSASYAATWAVGATIRASQNTNLVALAETTSIRAIDLISRFAQAELAMTRCDELDLFEYLPLSYWVESAQQTTADTLTTSANIADFTARVDFTRIRNSISLTYDAASIGATGTSVYTSTSVVSIPPGLTTLVVPFGTPVVALDTTTAFQLMTTATITTLPTTPFLSLNTAVDGTGSAVTTGVTATITAWNAGQADVNIVNSSGAVVYLARSDGGDVIGLVGQPVTSASATVTARDSTADWPRGERGMTASLSGIQDATFAQGIANALLGFFALPRSRVEQLRVFGDPRRQPGDLVAIQDVYGTRLSGLWRLTAVQHAMTGGTYEQTITAVQAWLTAVWDGTNWSQGLWGA